MVEERSGSEEMRPWEQHAAVISIPRFNYKTPSSLLENSHSGFLITCPIKREKSATKEAISILSKFVKSLNGDGSAPPVEVNNGGGQEGTNTATEEQQDSCNVAKKRKIFLEEKKVELADSLEVNEDVSRLGESEARAETTSGHLETNVTCGSHCPLSLVKLTGSGLLLLTYRENNYPPPISILSDIFASLHCGNLRPLQWCHRILPVQSTCSLKEKELQSVVSKLVQQFWENEGQRLSRPMKFAVGYNRRGIDEEDMKTQKNAVKDSDQLALLDRNKCFTIVAGAVKKVVEDSVVDLMSPELVVFVELLPLSGLAKGSLVAAVSALPHYLITVKPRLCVKALVSNSKTSR